MILCFHLGKNNQHSCNINVDSNHPRQLFKHIANGMMFRLPTNSSDIIIFTQSKHDYKLMLKNSGYKTKIVYQTLDETSNAHGGGKWVKENSMVYAAI